MFIRGNNTPPIKRSRSINLNDRQWKSLDGRSKNRSTSMKSCRKRFSKSFSVHIASLQIIFFSMANSKSKKTLSKSMVDESLSLLFALKCEFLCEPSLDLFELRDTPENQLKTLDGILPYFSNQLFPDRKRYLN